MIKGAIGTIRGLIQLIIVAAIFLAILPRFDWDIFALIFWVIEKIWLTITTLAEWIASSETFKYIFS